MAANRRKRYVAIAASLGSILATVCAEAQSTRQPAPPTKPQMLSWCQADGSTDADSAWRRFQSPATPGTFGAQLPLDQRLPQQVSGPSTVVRYQAPTDVYPEPSARLALKLRATAKRDDAAVRIRLYEANAEGLGLFCLASDPPASRVEMTIPSGFNGYVEFTREDLGPATELTIQCGYQPLTGDDDAPPASPRAWFSCENAAEVKAAREKAAQENAAKEKATQPNASQTANQQNAWFLEDASRGTALQVSIPDLWYSELVRIASCDYRSGAERATCKQDLKAPLPTNAGTQQQRGAATDTSRKTLPEVYAWISELAGRSSWAEFVRFRKAAHTEPIALFVGLGGVNATLLLDCRSVHGDGCNRFAEPWQTTLERAKYIWVAYLEDAAVPFDTTIDVEFRPRSGDVDYQEYDPRRERYLGVTVNDPQATLRRDVKFAVRRFRIREAPSSVQVAFTRQGQAYGTRQWQRAYHKLSDRRWAVAATVVLAAEPVKTPDVVVVEEPPVDQSTPTFGRLVREEGKNLVFGGLSLRWPSFRSRAADQPNMWQRLLWTAFTPDITFGIAPRGEKNPTMAALSWPLLWNRLHVTAGYAFVSERELKPGYRFGQLVPIDFDPSEAYTVKRRRETLISIAFDLVSTR